MAAGRVVADGPATQIKAAVDVRRIRATLPAADLDAARAGCRASPPVERQGGDRDPHLRRRRRRAARAGRDRAGAPATSRSRGADLEDAFLALTATARPEDPVMTMSPTCDSSCAASYRNPRYLFFTIGIPVVLFLVIGNAFEGDVFGVSAQTWYMVNMARVRRHGRRARRRCADRRRARQRLEPPAAADAAAAAGLRGRQGDDRHAGRAAGAGARLPRGASDRRRCTSGPPSGPRSSGSAGWRSCRWPSSASGSATSRSRRQRAGGQRRHGHADVDVRRHLVPDRRDLARTGCASRPTAMPTYWITQITRAPLTHAWPAARRLGWCSRSGWRSARGSRRAATAATTCARPERDGGYASEACAGCDCARPGRRARRAARPASPRPSASSSSRGSARWRLASGIWLVFLADAFVSVVHARPDLAAAQPRARRARWPSASATCSSSRCSWRRASATAVGWLFVCWAFVLASSLLPITGQPGLNIYVFVAVIAIMLLDTRPALAVVGLPPGARTGAASCSCRPGRTLSSRPADRDGLGGRLRPRQRHQAQPRPGRPPTRSSRRWPSSRSGPGSPATCTTCSATASP